jgi:hypothetical protein
MMKKVKKPKAPKLNASDAAWARYKALLSKYKAYLKAKEARRKLRDSI